MNSCGKRSYISENLALEALVGAKIAYPNSNVKTVYKCNDCGDWHITSKGNLHPKIANLKDSKKMDKLVEAAYWEHKLKY